MLGYTIVHRLHNSNLTIRFMTKLEVALVGWHHRRPSIVNTSSCVVFNNQNKKERLT